MNDDILLESGTNELELLEFTVGSNSYGINVAKVSEIMMDREITPIPNAPDEVEGIFIPRDKLISVIDLHKVLHTPKPVSDKEIIIVCGFNKMDVAFHVSSVKGIQRISWNDINEPPEVASGYNSFSGMATGVAKVDGRIIIILDFEHIVLSLNKSAGLDTSGIEDSSYPDSICSDKRIVVADDSQLLNKMIVNTLGSTGYKNIVSFQNGEDAWEYIEKFKECVDENHKITDFIGCVISDIEMPKMDGHRLTKLIKEDNILKNIPVILFSSLINEQMYKKGESVGADAQFTKPEINELIPELTKILRKE